MRLKVRSKHKGSRVRREQYEYDIINKQGEKYHVTVLREISHAPLIAQEG